MASRGRGRRERPQGTGHAQSVFDQRTFAEAVSIIANAIAQASIACNTPIYTLVIFDMYRVFCKHNLTVL